MAENTKIIQDLSLLYELSLAVGSSLDVTTNSLHFFRTILQRKNLTYASLWLKEPKEEKYAMACSYPEFRSEITSLAIDHPMIEQIKVNTSFSISSTEEGFEAFIQETKIKGGIYITFWMGDLGFVKLYANNRPDGFTKIELAQLEGVMDKFRVSLEGCLASQDLQREAAQRLAAQQAVELSNARLRESELKMRKIIDSSLDAVITINEEGLVTEWGRQTEQIFGHSREEALGKSLGEMIVPERYRAAHARGMKHFLNTGEGPVLNKLLELVGLHKDGHEFPIEISITAIQSDGGYFFSSFIRDITERKKIENALRQSEEKYRGIIENMELGLLEVDRSGKVVRAFDRFCHMTGYTNEELIGRQAEIVLLPEKYHATLAQQNEDRKKGLANIYEVELRRKDGALIWVLISGAPIYDSEGEMVGSLGIHYDITARRRLEQDLKEARRTAEQARAAEQQFLANMSHEIRTPMNTVIGMTHLLYETNPNASQKEYLHALRFSADSLLGIIDNILDMSKIESGKLEFESRAFNLQEMLLSLKRTFQFRVREKPISVDVEMDKGIKNLVSGDPTRLNQILTNLLSNASKFTEKGMIGVKASLLSKKPGVYEVQFVVHDTGIGIPADKVKVIFENFKQADVKITRKYGGTGLGLTIVRELVELQGGTLEVKSQLGQGSTFIINLKFGDTGKPATEKQEENAILLEHRKQVVSQTKVLIVEDNPMNQKLVKRILHIWDVAHEVVDNGVQAVAITQQEKFDIILMDIHMPEMDGFAATEAIRADASNLNQTTPIVALTAAALLTEKEAAFQSGMDDFLTKPFSPEKLQRTILKAIGFDDKLSVSDEKVIPSTSEVPKVDLTYLHEFSGGDPIFIKDMLETFLAETPDALVALENYAETEDWQEVYKLVHKLKPNLMMLGMQQLQEQAITIEATIKENDFTADYLNSLLEPFIQQVKLSFDPLQQELTQL